MSVRRWPLLLIAAPAAVSIWSGWVGLGGMSGFGIVHPAARHRIRLQLNTAITLPVGVESYGAYALGAWLTLAAGHPARAFAKRSAIGSLLLGMLGQVAYHLLAAAHARRAPWPVVVAVACMPVVTLGFGAALTHLLRSASVADLPDPTEERAALADDLAAGLAEWAEGFAGWAADVEPRLAGIAARPVLPAAPGGGQKPRRKVQPMRTQNRIPSRTRTPVSDADAEMHFATDLAASEVPSARRIQRELHVGQERASVLRAHLESVTART